jgi:hypothetical protein
LVKCKGGTTGIPWLTKGGTTGIFLKIKKDARILKYELEVEHIVVTMVLIQMVFLLFKSQSTSATF